MQLEKISNTKDETINMYEELFSKKTLGNETPETEDMEKNVEVDKKETENSQINESPESKDTSNNIQGEVKNQSFLKKIQKTIKDSSRMNLKYLGIGLLLGIITNISVYHYQSMTLQNNSQKLATGLVYNLSENNNLEQIATNIYLGMKENGWEPTVKFSNANAFVFELEKGGEFTITKSVELMSTKFHVSVSDFSQEMITALRIQLEPHKIGGTKNYINNKTYNSKTNTISFDIEKMNPNLDMPITIPNLIESMPIYPPLNAVPSLLPSPKPLVYINKSIDSKIINIPISKELDSKMVKTIKKDEAKLENININKNNENKIK